MSNRNILVIGAGHQGLTMAGYLAMHGEKVNLWNRTEENISSVISDRIIRINGVINGIATIEKASSNIAEVWADTILVTIPASGHKDIAKLIASYVKKNTKIILNPGRTFGILEFKNTLVLSGCIEMPIIAETQTIVFTCRKTNNNTVELLALKQGVFLAGLNIEESNEALGAVPKCIRNNFIMAQSYLETSMGNVGMILHCLPVLFNAGRIENQSKFRFYHDGITPSIAKILEEMDRERIACARALGIRVESVNMWMKRMYNVSGNCLFECINNNKKYEKIYAPLTLKNRYLEEDVPCGLVPVESVGKYYNISTPIISLTIDLANLTLNTDFRESGREFNKLES